MPSLGLSGSARGTRGLTLPSTELGGADGSAKVPEMLESSPRLSVGVVPAVLPSPPAVAGETGGSDPCSTLGGTSLGQDGLGRGR